MICTHTELQLFGEHTLATILQRNKKSHLDKSTSEILVMRAFHFCF